MLLVLPQCTMRMSWLDCQYIMNMYHIYMNNANDNGIKFMAVKVKQYITQIQFAMRKD